MVQFWGGTSSSDATAPAGPLFGMNAIETQLTHKRCGHILTNTGVWSPDGQWLVYDTRSDPAGEKFDGRTIEMVNIHTGEVQELYRSRNGAHCGVASFHPLESKVIFILGPEHPTPDWSYCAWHRRGVILDTTRPGTVLNLDARDLMPPFTPGALRGGTHLHLWEPAGQWVSFTYEDHEMASLAHNTAAQQTHSRNIGVSVPDRPVGVPATHRRNHSAEYFTVLITRTSLAPVPGSDQILRASEEAWIGTNGYVLADGSRQARALAFQGQVLTSAGKKISEAFVVDLPAEVWIHGEGPLEGTAVHEPFPPKGTTQRRLTCTADRKYPGLQGPRHWLRSSPNGARIACLLKDDQGIVQLWTVSPAGGPLTQLTHNPWPIASAFTWSPDGHALAHIMDNSVCVTDAQTGATTRLTARTDDPMAPRPEACVFSPDARHIASVRPTRSGRKIFNQIWIVSFSGI